MSDIIEFQKARIEALELELLKHKAFIAELQSDVQKFINEIEVVL